MPLFIALRGIERSFDNYDAKPRRSRSVKSLFYCQEEVEAQHDEWLAAQTGASSAESAKTDEPNARTENGDGALPFPPDVIIAHFARVRGELNQARNSRGENNPDELSEAIARSLLRLEELEGDFRGAARPDVQSIEDGLTQLEELLERAMIASMPVEEVGRERRVAEEQLRSYKDRMERSTYEQMVAHLTAKTLRQKTGVPRLSLFYL